MYPRLCMTQVFDMESIGEFEEFVKILLLECVINCVYVITCLLLSFGWSETFSCLSMYPRLW